MQRVSFLFIGLFCLLSASLSAQEALPGITVKNLNGQIIVSWVNNYKIPVSNINIQRSYDSLKNFTTIGSVLNPQNLENGYADSKPPYNKMYYRVFVSFEGGSYVFSKVSRPVKEMPVVDTVTTINATAPVVPADTSFPFLIRGRDKSAVQTINDPKNKDPKNILPKTNLPTINAPEIITYPSRRIFTAKDNNIIILLPEAENKRYTVKFFEENDAPLFELNKLHENYLIVEKVNFVHAGWFHFEIYENGRLIEKNKFFISKDGKSQQ
jgi:hypothetical protein